MLQCPVFSDSFAMAEELDVSDILQEGNGANEEDEDDDDEEAMTAPEVLQKLKEVCAKFEIINIVKHTSLLFNLL